jgi:hypothetical protein
LWQCFWKIGNGYEKEDYQNFSLNPHGLFSTLHCKKGHAKIFSSELIHILLLKIQKVSNISWNSL